MRTFFFCSRKSKSSEGTRPRCLSVKEGTRYAEWLSYDPLSSKSEASLITSTLFASKSQEFLECISPSAFDSLLTAGFSSSLKELVPLWPFLSSLMMTFSSSFLASGSIFFYELGNAPRRWLCLVIRGTGLSRLDDAGSVSTSGRQSWFPMGLYV